MAKNRQEIPAPDSVHNPPNREAGRELAEQALIEERKKLLEDPIALARVLGYHDTKVLDDYGNVVSFDLDEVHHELLADLWGERHPRRIYLMPRGSLKTSLVTISYTVREVLRNPNCRLGIVAETYPKSKKFLSAIKDHLKKNPTIIKL